MDIRTLRQHHKVKLRELAQMLDLTQTELSKYERGLALPNEKVFFRLADIFKVELTQLKLAQEELFRYATPGEGYTTAKSPHSSIIHSKVKARANTIRVLDLFCGTGGFSHGFEQTGVFEVVLGLDLLNDRAATFQANHSMQA